MTRTFDQVGLYAAFSEAQRYLAARNFTVGPIAPGKSQDPAGIALGYVKLPLWSAMSKDQRAQLSGQISPARGRHLISGPIEVEIYDLNTAAVAAFSKPHPGVTR